MPNTDSLQSLADIPALEKEFKFIVGGLSGIKANIIELNRLEVLGKQKSSIRDVTIALKDLNPVLIQNNTINKGLVQTQIQQERLRERRAKAMAAEALEEKRVVELIASETKANDANTASIERQTKAKKTKAANDLQNRPINTIPFEIKGNLGGDLTDGGQIKNLDATRNAMDDLAIAEANVANESVALSDTQTALGRQLKTNAAGATSNALLTQKQAAANALLIKSIKTVSDENKQLIISRDNVNTNLGGSTRQIALFNRVIDDNNTFINKNKSLLEQQKNNVGNYADGVEKGSSKIAKGVGKIFGVVRNLAYILPGIGIAGIFSLAGDAVVSLVTKLFDVTKAIDKVKGSQDTLNKAFNDDGYKEAVKNVQELTTYVELARKGFLDKKVVLDEYNKVLGDTVGKASSLDDAEALLVKNGPAYIQMTLYKAAANLALNEAAQLAVDIAKDAQDPNSQSLAVTLRRTDAEQKFGKQIRQSAQYTKLLRDENNAYNKSISERTPETVKAYQQIKGAADAFFEDQLQLLAGGKKEKNRRTLVDIAGDFQKNAALYSKQFGFDLFGNKDKATPKTKTPRDNESDAVKNREDERKSLFEVLKRQLQDEIDLNENLLTEEKQSFDERLKQANLSYDAFVDVDKKTFDEKLFAAKNYYDVSLKLIKAQRTYEVDELNAQEAEEIRKANLTIKNKKELSKVLESINDEYSAKRKLVDINENSAVLKLNQVSEKQFTELAKKSSGERAKAKEEIEKTSQQHTQSLHEREMQALQNSYDADLVALDKRFLKGKIREDKYNKQKLKLQLGYQAELLEADIRFTKETIDLAAARAEAETDPAKRQQLLDQVATARLKLASLETQLQKLLVDNTKATNKTLLEDFERTLNKIKDIAGQVFDVISGFIGATAEKEKNELQAQIDLLETKKQKDIEVANQTIANATERAAAIQVIEQRAAAQRELLEIKQRQADERRARFEKAATIAKIILETASAVVHQLTSGDPVTAIGRAIVAGVLGAAQLAVAIATPIPKYRDGVRNHPGGLAWVGDGGKSEGITMPDGTVFKTPSAATLIDLPAGSSVDPDFDRMQLRGAPNVRVNVPYNSDIALKRVGKDIVMAIKTKREIHVKGLPRHNTYLKDGHSFRRYVNDRI